MIIMLKIDSNDNNDDNNNNDNNNDDDNDDDDEAIIWDKRLTSVTPLYQIPHDRICGVRLQCENSSVVNIFCVYMPARGCADDLETTLDELSAIVEGTEIGSYNILCGDFNADLGCKGGPRSTKNPEKRGGALYNFTTQYGYIPANLMIDCAGPVNTHYGPTGESCIDYILVPDALIKNAYQCEVHDNHPLNTSDHLPVSLSLNIGAIPRCTTDGPQPTRLRWDKLSQALMLYKYQIPLSVDLEKILGDFSILIPDERNVDNLMDEIIKVLKVHEKVIPKARFRKNIKSYWCPELDTLKRIKIQAFRNWVTAGRPRDPCNQLYQDNKTAKKNFRKRLKLISREYEESKVAEAVRKAELDSTTFWKMLKREREGPRVKTPSVKNPTGKVVHDVSEILDVWKNHFSSLGTPIESESFDKAHFERVTSRIAELSASREIDDFSRESISEREVEKGINLLNAGKAPGDDSITREHIKNAGPSMVKIITLLFNWIVTTEFIPTNFRKGIQVPLYKGKNTSTMEVNNYRGITLLSVFNKLFEVVIWKRLERWWTDSGVLTQLQGSCRKGVSCVHSAFLLQESISTLLENNDKVFVTYLDVSKAFDGVWIGGLFMRLWEMGVRGRTWRLLFNSYKNFKCRVRVQNELSEWYPLRCGIHQGGYLSLLKYLAFINSLLVDLENSGLCCAIYGISVSPLGYADDIATASISKNKTDRVLQVVYNHSRTWRYNFNPKKSAVLVYGESPNINKLNSAHRYYRLGGEVIKEATSYDHLGLKNNCLRLNGERTRERISKGRKALNAAAGLGLKPGGLTIQACGLIFWSMVIPIITFASELWVLNDEDVGLLNDFQVYAGRRVQRLHQKSPRETSYIGLGWISIEIFIYVKKLLFIRTIMVMKDDSVYRRVFINRYRIYVSDRPRYSLNVLDSPVFDIMRIVDIFGLHNEVNDMVQNTRLYSKMQWRKIVWAKAWQLENRDWKIRASLFKVTKYIGSMHESVKPLIWWQIGDMSHDLMKNVETMVKLVTRASKLKSDCYQFKNDTINRPYCDLCHTHAIEDVKHILMHCPSLTVLRNGMYKELHDIERKYEITVLLPSECNLTFLLGKMPVRFTPYMTYEICRVIACNVQQMYTHVLKNRAGVG